MANLMADCQSEENTRRTNDNDLFEVKDLTAILNLSRAINGLKKLLIS